MKLDLLKGHKKPKPPVTGTVLRNVEQTDFKGNKSFRRVDVQDVGGDIHITVPVRHPLAKVKAGDTLTISQA